MNWIKLSDRLPPREKVLFYHRDHGFFVGNLNSRYERIEADDLFMNGNDYFADSWDLGTVKITHWCEIEEPKE